MAEAIEIEKKGLKVAMPADDLDLPGEMVQAFAADPGLASAFEALTPGRRRSWILHIRSAKKSPTRALRIERAASKIRAGKGWNER